MSSVNTYSGVTILDLDSIPLLKGKSAYEIAVMNGFQGTEVEWLDSLKIEFQQKANDFLDDAQAKEKARQINENSRIDSEISRVASEQTRLSNEANRVLQEEQRVEDFENMKIYCNPEAIADIRKKLELLDNKADKKRVYNVFVDAENWSDTAPYTKIVNVEGITEGDIVHMSPLWSSDSETRAVERTEYSKFSRIDSVDGGVKLLCDEDKISVNLNVRFMVIG